MDCMVRFRPRSFIYPMTKTHRTCFHCFTNIYKIPLLSFIFISLQDQANLTTAFKTAVLQSNPSFLHLGKKVNIQLDNSIEIKGRTEIMRSDFIGMRKVLCNPKPFIIIKIRTLKYYIWSLFC